MGVPLIDVRSLNGSCVQCVAQMACMDYNNGVHSEGPCQSWVWNYAMYNGELKDVFQNFVELATWSPTAYPTASPTASPTDSPTTASPTASPTVSPTVSPTAS